MKFAKICFAGLPNVGKSTLFNAILSQYIAPVTYKPQTTINQMLYILNENDIQIALYDLPGMINKNIEMKNYINKTIRSVLLDVDIILLVIDASKPIIEEEKILLRNIQQIDKKVIIVLNKIDLVKNADKILYYQQNFQYTIVTEKKTHSILKKYLFNIIPEGKHLYEHTQLNLKDWSCEITRKFILELFEQEVPYNIDVRISLLKEKEDSILIYQDIIVHKKSYKPMFLRNNGEILKKISQNSRKIISDYTKKKVHLFLNVKIVQGK